MKYKILKNKVMRDKPSHNLYCIQALKSFGGVKEGDLGGWIENEDNLSQEGNCWIYEEAKVYGDAKVFENAKIYGKSVIAERAWIHGNSIVIDSKVTYGYYFNHLIIPKDHPDFWDYRLEHPDLEVIYLDK